MREARRSVIGAARTVLLAGTGVLVLLVATVFLAAKRAETSGRATAPGSSFRADETGLRAAKLLLEDLGFVVESRRGARYPRGIGHVLIREEGLPGTDVEELPEREREKAGADLVRWIERGNGALVFAARTPPGSGWPAVRARFELPTEEIVVGPVATTVEEEDPLTLIFGRRPDVPTGGGAAREEHTFAELRDPWVTPYHVLEPGPDDEVLLVRVTDTGAREPLIVRSRRGLGSMIVVADPWFATNVRLARGDNAAWLATLVDALHEGGDVWFDDRAVGQQASRGVLSLFAEAGFGPTMAALALLLLVVWWRVGPSDAPDRVTRPQQRYRPSAYVELRAGLYTDSLTADDVRTMVRNEVARRLSRGNGVPYERAIAMLETRDARRADRVRRALEQLPTHADVTVRRHVRTWCAAVAAVWRELPGDPDAPDLAETESDSESDRDPDARRVGAH